SSLPDFVQLLFPVVAFAAAVGGFVWLVRYIGGKDKSSPEHEGQTASVTSSESESPAPMDEQRDLLCVSRTKDGLVISVQGQRRRSLQAITDPQVGRETVEAIKAVLEFSEGWLPSMRQQVVSPPVSSEATVDQETFLSQLRHSFSPSSKKPPGLLAPLERQTSSNLLDPLHLVEEIDDLVQQRLRERPELTGCHVRLTTGATGGLRIYVGQQAFGAVDDIPDPQIKALVQAAIREWESR
ncbi:MAG: hypothetical protein U9R15_00865, partial [Chloroflexota bacterium]|nr:hypothetical protein [Chloroflexota bacterium]